MKKNILKSTCIVMALISSITVFTGCNKKLTVKYDCTPTDYVKVGQYKGLSISVDEAAITKSYVDAKVQSDLDTVTTYNAVDRASQKEDQITLAFTGSIGGEAIDGFGSDSYSLVLGKDTFRIPGFVDALYGLKTGDTKVITLTVPDPFTDEPDYAGKRIVYDITVLNVEAPVAPQITDAYAKQYFSYDTLDEYKAALQANMQDEINKEINQKENEAAMKALEANVEVLGYPEDIVNTKRDETEKSISFYSTLNGQTVEEYCQAHYNISLDEYARNAVILELALEDIITKENLSIDEYYYKANLSSFASDNGYSNADSFVQKYGKDKIVKNMLIQKAVDVVVNSAVNTTK